MSAVVKTHLVKIGNSRGVRIPKVWIDQIGLSEEVELAVQPNQLVIRPARRPRQGWDEQFLDMAERGDDRLLDPDTTARWDETEWEW